MAAGNSQPRRAPLLRLGGDSQGLGAPTDASSEGVVTSILLSSPRAIIALAMPQRAFGRRV